MSKVTFLNDLHTAYKNEILAKQERCNSPYKNMPKERWFEVCEAHNRRVKRQCHRSVGKSNKLGVRRTARGMAGFLREIQMWSEICRNNRRSGGISND